MGVQPYHLSADDVKAQLASCGDIGTLSSDRVQDKYLIVAEAMLDEEFSLGLDSIGFPSQWVPHFDNAPQGETRRAEFLQAFNAATLLVIERLALNPHDLNKEQTGRVRVTHGPKIPIACHSLLARWGRSNQIFRA